MTELTLRPPVDFLSQPIKATGIKSKRARDDTLNRLIPNLLAIPGPPEQSLTARGEAVVVLDALRVAGLRFLTQ